MQAFIFLILIFAAMSISLNKYISDTGFCSRRKADKYIEEGRVTINGQGTKKGNRVMEYDNILIDGEPLKKRSSPVYIMLNKPKGITCTTDLKDKSNIIDFINYKTRIFPIGRLDKLSEGLIFLTNDGDIVNKILRSANGHEKEYVVTTDKIITKDFVDKMRNGVRILGTVTNKCFVKQDGDKRFTIILNQGLNRQIRRMCAALDYKVTSLKRVRIMHISLGNLRPGKWRYFSSSEIEELNKRITNSTKTVDVESIGE